MNSLKTCLETFIWSDDGPTTTEYAVLLAMLTIVVLGMITLLGQHVQGRFAATNN
jgi:pilus assembly protein Flp/PilA